MRLGPVCEPITTLSTKTGRHAHYRTTRTYIQPRTDYNSTSPSIAEVEVIAGDVLQRLIDAAKAASRNAYCPYSGFRVGAAVLGGSGKVFGGCNVENASYGITICAERSAVARAITDGETKIDAVVIYTPTPMPTAPCGACRQA